jgi:alkylation response protein AidB-like acyl-CoA dehydrogenase
MTNATRTLAGSQASPAAASLPSAPLDVLPLLAEVTEAAVTGWRPVAELAEDALVAALAQRAGMPVVGGIRAGLSEHDPGDQSWGISTVVSGMAPLVLEGEKARVARSATGSYVVLARRGADLNLAVAHDGCAGVDVKAAGPDAFGVDRIDLAFSGCPVEELYAIGGDAVEQARLLAALVVAAGAVERLRLLVGLAGGAAHDLPAGRSPLRHQDGQFALADMWRDGAAAARLVARAGDLLAEGGGTSPEAQEAACVAAVAATEGLVRAVNGLLRIFEHDGERIPGLAAELLAAHEAGAAFVSNRRLRLRIAGLRGMSA